MHSKLVSVALFAALASASTLFARQVRVSPCVGNCVTDGDRGDCSESEGYNCLCNDTPYINSVFECVEKTCTSADLAAAREAAREICLPLGVTLPPAFGIESATTSSAAMYGSASTRSSAPASSTTNYAATVSSTSAAPAATSKSAGSTVDFDPFAGLAGVAAFAGLAALLL
ncbi:hypothetical protein K443DRAFT_680643 [Laccaria amethystina LaAM-08-1]|uniref:CFEM domain-containing protein n=1 Tax=Laccaria amethystina LaAM-08-1 TaxID=1095629 RepID=A0A0C9WMY2_9AGAR|nr:hypothetical protein K443DRAFT_680643 [Laccaria amethystina LaAM-08-1]